MTSDLSSAFQGLPAPTSRSDSALVFTAVQIGEYPRHRIGKDGAGAPSLLIAVANRQHHLSLPPIVLEHLTVLHDVDCVVTDADGKVEEGTFTVVRCTGNDRVLNAYFLRVASTIVVLLGNEPSDTDVRRAIDRLVELFRSMGTASGTSVQGLWAEMLVMARAPDTSQVVAAWHAQPSDKFDFNSGAQRIEVKSAAGRVRAHHFSLDQLLPIPGAQVLVCSVLVGRAGAGVSIVDLATEVRSRVGSYPELLLRIDQVVTQTLGIDWRQAEEERFDRQSAEDSLAFYEPAAIPKIDQPLPSSVTDVHFQVDLTGVPPADVAACRRMGGLFTAALRR